MLIANAAASGVLTSPKATSAAALQVAQTICALLEPARSGAEWTRGWKAAPSTQEPAGGGRRRAGVSSAHLRMVRRETPPFKSALSSAATMKPPVNCIGRNQARYPAVSIGVQPSTSMKYTGVLP